jgi:hypothetical protein
LSFTCAFAGATASRTRDANASDQRQPCLEIGSRTCRAVELIV